jgi:hypothetical protein
MSIAYGLRRLAFAILAHAVIAVGALSIPLSGVSTPAAAQISEDAQVALEQYGAWRPHPRFGEVWVPAAVPPDWRPYQYGHWVYTDEWGWYWVSDDAEADWGWVVYHYGRWAFERGLGWFWVPGDEWAPAWVNWRYGDEYAGWAPLPPDELIETYEAEPAYWVFVPTRFVGAPRLRTYIVPPFRRSAILRGTHVVNRTVPVHGRLAVNPGISPAFVARVNGAPVATYRVHPRVFAATQGVSGAVQVRREDLRGRNGRPGGPAGPGRPGRAGSPGAPARLGAISVERTTTVIRPNATVAPPQPLGKNERGRLGTSPPRAAQGSPSVVPLQQQPAGSPPAARQNQTPALQQQAPPGVAPPKTPTTPTAPPPATPRPLERRDRSGPGGPAGPGGPPSQQPNIVRPIPPQAPPPASPPPPAPQQRQVQPPPPPAAHPPPAARPPAPPPPVARPPAPPPPAARPPAPPPPAARPPAPPPPAALPPAPPPQAPAPPRPTGPPPKKPPPKPGEKPDEKK